MSKAELSFLADVASKSKIILEIGSYQGRSTRALADNTDGKVYAIDTWNYQIYGVIESGMTTYNAFYCNLYNHIKSGKVIMHRGTWRDYFASDYDFIFIDGDHTYESARHDIDKALRHLKPSGIIAGHDYCESWPGVVKAVDELIGKFNLTETIWWAQKS